MKVHKFIFLSSLFCFLSFSALKAQATSEPGTGIEDDFEIMADTTCQNYPTDRLIPGSRYSYKVCYHDNAPLNMAPANFKWKLELFYKDRSNKISSSSLVTADGYLTDPFDYTYSMYVPNLPAFGPGWVGNRRVKSRTWLRNQDGTIKAKLSVSALGGFYAEMDVKIVYPPDVPKTEITMHDCQSATLDFSSEGASSYIIHYTTVAGAPYENVANVPEGNHTYTFNNLPKNNDYYFKVEAINAEGLSTWGYQVNKNNYCSVQVDVFPNPAMVELEILFKEYLFNAADNLHYTLHSTNGEKLLEGKIYTPSQLVSLPSLPTAIYLVSIYRGGTMIKTEKIVVL